MLRHWIKSFITDTASRPESTLGAGNASRLDTEPGLREHLQSVGKYVKAQDIVDYVNRPEVVAKYGPSISICLKTAQHWMESLGYTWATMSGTYFY